MVSTAADDLSVRIPKLRTGSFFPILLEPRRRVDVALTRSCPVPSRHSTNQQSATRRYFHHATGLDHHSRDHPVWFRSGRQYAAGVRSRNSDLERSGPGAIQRTRTTALPVRRTVLPVTVIRRRRLPSAMM